MAIDDGKRTELISVKVTERMLQDLQRLASLRERSISDFIYCGMRQELYGAIVRLEGAAAKSISSDVVNRPR